MIKQKVTKVKGVLVQGELRRFMAKGWEGVTGNPDSNLCKNNVLRGNM